MSIDKGVGELMDMLRSTADVKTPATNFIALGRDSLSVLVFAKCSSKDDQKVWRVPKGVRRV